MEWTDTGVVLSARPHGEGHAVVDVFTRDHGRWAGLVFGGSGRKMSPIVQSGNRVKSQWRGRMDDSLGHYALELMSPIAAGLMSDRLSLAGLSAACALSAVSLPERQAHERIYAGLNILLENFDSIEIWPALMARWELGLLGDLGFGLSLDTCAATGDTQDLVYVSPKSASAVSREAGEPYKDKLLPLPPFMRGQTGAVPLSDAIDGLTTTGHFIETRILHLANAGLPEARIRVLDMLKAKLADA